jgi:hypothetical protein
VIANKRTALQCLKEAGVSGAKEELMCVLLTYAGGITEGPSGALGLAAAISFVGDIWQLFKVVWVK